MTNSTDDSLMMGDLFADGEQYYERKVQQPRNVDIDINDTIKCTEYNTCHFTCDDGWVRR